MPQKRYKPEEIIPKLRVAEKESSKGYNTGQICRKLGITEQTYYRWRKQYGGMKVYTIYLTLPIKVVQQQPEHTVVNQNQSLHHL